ncbi:unnamed protein product, partial [Ectocarpus fasciculatus]
TEPSPQGFSFSVAVAFSVNYIMGTGFLTLPWAFSQTGYLSFLVVVLVTAASVFAVNMALETMARADVYKKKHGNVVGGEDYEELDVSTVTNPMGSEGDDSRNGHEEENGDEGAGKSTGPNGTSASYDKIKAGEEEESLDGSAELGTLPKGQRGSKGDAPADREGEGSLDEEAGPYMVQDKKFEVTEQCRMFLGPVLQLSYMLFLCCYMFGSLWAYGTVFSNALASNLPLPGINSYLLYLFMFGCIVVPISCMELEEQIVIQVALSFGRVLMVILMVGSILVSTLWGHESDFGTDMMGGGSLAAFDASGIHHLLPIAAFAHIFHHSIPALSQPVRDKTRLSYIYTTTLVCCFLAYSAIGLSVSLYFGSNTLSSSNLNWVDYGHNSSGFSYFMKRVVGTFIVMFPALDVASAFPLNAVTLGNNLFSVAYGKKVHLMANSKPHRTAFRLLGAIPPLIMAALVSDLGQITDYTGVTGFGIAFIFPPMLSFYSAIKLRGKGMPAATIYSSRATDPHMCLLLFTLGLFLSIYVPIALSSGS